MILKNGMIFRNGRFIRSDIFVLDGEIQFIAEKIDSSTGVTDCSGKYIIPGLVDIHTHGCAGYDFSSADEKEIEVMQKYYLENGVTSVLPTTVALSNENIEKAVNNIKKAKESDCVGARIQGINLEGPYLSPAKCGAHDISLLKEPDIDFVEALGDDIKVVHVAPEYKNAYDFIKKFKGKTSVAHTACTYAQAMEAIDLGADHITHIFNAMNPLHHREPGVIGAFFDSYAVAEIICDSIHINPAILRMMFNAYSNRIAVISDSMAATGLSNGTYKLGALDVFVENSVAKLSDGTLAGSAMNLMQMVQNLIKEGIAPEKAILSATKIPAESVGIGDICGELDSGRKADILVLNSDFTIDKIIFNGEFVS